MQSKAKRLAMIKESAKKFQAKQNRAARFVREEKVKKIDKDERYWTDASSYAEQYYGETFRATTRFDNDWD